MLKRVRQERGEEMAEIRIRPYDPSYAHEAVTLWRLSKEAAIGQKEIHSLDSHVRFLKGVLAAAYEIYLAFEGERLVGLAVFDSVELNQLYVGVEHQGKGIGKRLLDIAKAHSNGSLFLYTFEVNTKAQRFYEKNGFTEIGRGCENEENLPDIKYEWKANRLSK
jgi:ribosomal protein S18 acetylase RimI-like enzyme